MVIGKVKEVMDGQGNFHSRRGQGDGSFYLHHPPRPW
jgi:hypothetical protein